MKRRAKRLGLILLALSAGLGAQVIGGGGSGNATSLQGKPVAATAPSNGNCLVFTTQWGPGSCSGTASTNWSSLVSGTNTTGAFLIGTGASLGVTGSGTISANQLNGGTVPASAAVLGTNSSSQPTAAATTGSGSVVLATSPTLTTPNLGTPSAINLSNATSLPCSATPALTGDVTTSAGNCATSVVKINGGAVPASALALGSNSSGQPTVAALPWHCEMRVGDGTNAVAAATYTPAGCRNTTGQTVTITGVWFYTDNNGSSTGNVTNGAGTGLLTGAITGTNAWASGTQSGTTTLAANDYLKFSIVADGASKQGVIVVAGTY